jgi:hypothetical protein
MRERKVCVFFFDLWFSIAFSVTRYSTSSSVLWSIKGESEIDKLCFLFEVIVG